MFSLSTAQKPLTNRGSIMSQINENKDSLTTGNMHLFNEIADNLSAEAFADGTRNFNGPIKRGTRYRRNFNWPNQNRNFNFGSHSFQRAPPSHFNPYGAESNVNLFKKDRFSIDQVGSVSRSYNGQPNDFNPGIRFNWRLQ
ncbi:hypothetical protein ACKWTF_009007 [Chironomus riparius]